MTRSHYKCDPSDQVEYLNSLGNKELSDWIVRFLATGASGPLLLSDSGVGRAVDLVSLCRVDKTGTLRKRIGRIVVDILRDLRWCEISAPLLIGSLLAVGELRCTRAYNVLLRMAKSSREDLRELVYKDLNGHHVLLRVLIGLGNSFDLGVVLQRDAQDTRYAGVIFRGLWEFGGGHGIKKAMEFLPTLIDLQQRTSEFDVSELLLDFLAFLGDESFATLVPPMLSQLGPERFESFASILKRCGVELTPESRYSLLMRWDIIGDVGPKYHIIPIFPSHDGIVYGDAAARFDEEIDWYLTRDRVAAMARVSAKAWSRFRRDRQGYIGAMARYHTAMVSRLLSNHLVEDRETIAELERAAKGGSNG